MPRRALSHGIPLAILAMVAALALAPPALAAPPDTFGLGSRETAMGGAVAADVRGFAAGYYNPAALARSRGFEVGLGYFHAGAALSMNGKDSGVAPAHGAVGGLVVPGHVFGLPVAFGVAFHLPDQHLVRTSVAPQEEPRWALYEDASQRLYLSSNLAIQPAPWLWLGGGLSFLSSTRANLDITGSANIFRPDDSQLRHQVEADLIANRYPQAGARIALGDRVALAAVYRGQVKLGLDLSARLAGDVSGLTTALYEVTTASVSDFLPQQVVLGGAWKVLSSPRLTATFDATWIDWSAFVPPAAAVDAHLDVPPPAGGYPAGITPPVSPLPIGVTPLRMHDRVVPRVGVEWEALSGQSATGFVRAGYAQMKSPIDAQTGSTNYVDRDLHAFSIGLGAAFRGLGPVLPGTLTIDAHLQVLDLVTDTTRKASPADLVGDYTAGGTIVNVGITAGFAFSPRDALEKKK
jgi:long-chain fatty acid transport protein